MRWLVALVALLLTASAAAQIDPEASAPAFQEVEYTAADGTVKKISAAEAAARMQDSMKDMEWEGDKLVKKQSGQVLLDELEEKHPELANFIGMAKFALKSLQAVGYAEGTISRLNTVHDEPTEGEQTQLEMLITVAEEQGNKQHEYKVRFEKFTRWGDNREMWRVAQAWRLKARDSKKSDEEPPIDFEIKLPQPPAPSWRNLSQLRFPPLLVTLLIVSVVGLSVGLILRAFTASSEAPKEKSS